MNIMAKKKQSDKSKEKPPDEAQHKNIEHDQELPEQPLTKEEELNIIPGDDETDKTTPPYEPPPPGEGP